MATLGRLAPQAAALAVALFIPSITHAQEPRFRALFSPAVVTVASDAELSLGGTFGYRATQHFWFEGDVVWIDAAAGGFQNRDFRLGGPITGAVGLTDLVRQRVGTFGRPGTNPSTIAFPSVPTFPAILPEINGSTSGTTFIGTMGGRWEFPVETSRFRPYVSGGFGLNNTDQRFRISATSMTSAIDQTVSRTGYALSAGGGASIRVTGQIWADVGAKYYRLSDDRDMVQLGGGVGVRF